MIQPPMVTYGWVWLNFFFFFLFFFFLSFSFFLLFFPNFLIGRHDCILYYLFIYLIKKWRKVLEGSQIFKFGKWFLNVNNTKSTRRSYQYFQFFSAVSLKFEARFFLIQILLRKSFSKAYYSSLLLISVFILVVMLFSRNRLLAYTAYIVKTEI